MRDTIWTYLGSVAERPAAAGSARWRKGLPWGDEKGRSGCCCCCGCGCGWCEGDGTLESMREEADVDEVGVSGSFGMVKGCCDVWVWDCGLVE